MKELNAHIDDSDKDGVTKIINDHIKEEQGRNLAGIYKAIRKGTDEQGKQAFRLTIFRQMLNAVLKHWFLPTSELSSDALNDLLVELLADVSLLSAAECSALCEVIIDNLGCPMTLELLSSLLLHASSTGARLPWKGNKVTDFKQALVSALVDKLPWKDDIVVHIAKFFREIELNNSLLATVNPVLSPYISSLPSSLLLPFLSQILPIHPAFLQQVLHRLDPRNIDEATRAGVLAECVAATRQNPGIAKSVQALIKSNPVAILSDAFKFRLCLSVGSIHRNFQTPTQNALRAAVALHCDYELKRYEARWLSETLPVHAPLALVEACTLSTSDDKVFLTTNCLIDFGFLLLKTKTPSRVAQQGALMLLTLCQTSSQGGTVQAVLDQLLRTLFQNPSKECADLLAKLPCGQLPASAGWDVISALPSVDPQVARTLVRVILESCPQIRNELVMSLRKCLFLNDPTSRLVAANGLLEIIAFFTVDDDDVSQNPNGRICLEALELIRRILVEQSQSTAEIRHCILRGFPDLIKANRLLKESIFELLQELLLQNASDPHTLMAVASCLCSYRRVHIKGTQKSQTLKWLFKRLVSMANNVEEASHVDALILLSTEFGVDCSSVLEKLKEIRGTQDAVNNSDTTIASTASKAPRRKKVEKPAKHECLLPNDVLCSLLKSDAVNMEIRLYTSDALASRKRIEPHERRQLLSALKDVLTKPYVDTETKACCVQLMSTNFQNVVQDVFNSEDIPAAREDLLKELAADSNQSLFKYFVEMIKQAKSTPERKADLGALIACVQCMCLLFPDDVNLMSEIYTWADDESSENTIEYMPLLLDLSSHISGGLAVLKRFSQRLSRLCGVLETSAEAPDANFQGLHVENLEELFVLLNAVVKSTTNQLDWVYSKIELTEEMEPAFIKQLYYLIEALSTVAHSEVPLVHCDTLLHSAAKVYKVLTSLAKFYGSKNRADVSVRYPKLVRFVQKVCTPRFEALILRVEEEAARRNIGKKKQTSKEQQAVPAFVFAVEQHHHELQKLSKKIELGDISTPAAARDFRIKVNEVRKHQDEWSDEEIPNSQRPAGNKSLSSARVSKRAPSACSTRKSDESSKPSKAAKRKESMKVAWPPKKGKVADDVAEDEVAETDAEEEVVGDEHRSAFPDSENEAEPAEDPPIVASPTRQVSDDGERSNEASTRASSRSSKENTPRRSTRAASMANRSNVSHKESSPTATVEISPPKKRRRTLGIRR